MLATELIELLQEQVDTYGAGVEVKVAQQPAWPLAATISNVRNSEEFDEGDPVIWIATTEEGGYAPKEAWG